MFVVDRSRPRPPPPLLNLSLSVVLHHGQVLRQVLEADLDLWVLGVGELKELNDQQVGFVPELGRLAGVGGQQVAEAAQVLLRVVHRLLHAPRVDVSAHQHTARPLIGSKIKGQSSTSALLSIPKCVPDREESKLRLSVTHGEIVQN